MVHRRGGDCGCGGCRKEQGRVVGHKRGPSPVIRSRRVRDDGASTGRGAAAVSAVLPVGPVKVGVEAAGHYHRPLLGSGCGQRAGRCWSSVRLG